MDRDRLIREFNLEMRQIYVKCLEIDYRAKRFLNMLNERGEFETALALLSDPDIHYGFTVLWEKGRLDLSVEALVLREPWRQLFTKEQLAMAEQKLLDAEYDPSKEGEK